MLVLSRKCGEKIIIGNDITVVITKVEGNRVGIGIEAPPHVGIQRGELLEAQETVKRRSNELQSI